MKYSTAGKGLSATVLVVAATVAAIRCSNRSKPAKENSGTLELQVGPSTKMTAPSWRIQNSALSIDRSGSVDVSKGQTIEDAIEGLPAGSGYTISLEAATNGPNRVDCTASGGFDIAAGLKSPVSLNLVCGVHMEGGRGGPVLLNGATPVTASCAAVTALSASPSEAAMGGSMALAARAVDGTGSSQGLRFSWSVTGGLGGGSFDSAFSATPRFTCTAPGLLFVAVTAMTSAGGNCPNSTASVSLVCDNPGTGPGESTGPASSAGSPGSSQGNRPGSPPDNSPGSSSGCVPSCAGKLCGDDGCGGSCGDCGAEEACGDAGVCVDPCSLENAGGPCTPTERMLVKKSVACYQCLIENGCLDDVRLGDTGHECGDVVGTAKKGAKLGVPRSALCLTALECTLSSNCAAEDVALCYCGSLGPAIACSTGNSGADGFCVPQEVDGLEHVSTDPPHVIMTNYFNLNLGAGMANQIFACARSGHCDPCLR
jgi:hypothetical protein